jgi:hypothetical protein
VEKDLLKIEIARSNKGLLHFALFVCSLELEEKITARGGRCSVSVFLKWNFRSQEFPRRNSGWAKERLNTSAVAGLA